jgi:hypothetical protein
MRKWESMNENQRKDWTIEWMIERMNEWMIESMNEWLIDCLIVWLFDCLIDWIDESLTLVYSYRIKSYLVRSIICWYFALETQFIWSIPLIRKNIKLLKAYRTLLEWRCPHLETNSLLVKLLRISFSLKLWQTKTDHT